MTYTTSTHPAPEIGDEKPRLSMRRKCNGSGCITILNGYNEGDLCYVCQRRQGIDNYNGHRKAAAKKPHKLSTWNEDIFQEVVRAVSKATRVPVADIVRPMKIRPKRDIGIARSIVCYILIDHYRFSDKEISARLWLGKSCPANMAAQRVHDFMTGRRKPEETYENIKSLLSRTISLLNEE